MAGEVFADLVQMQQASITGTGSYTLASLTGYRTFASAIGTSGLVRYRAWSVDSVGNPDGNGWEIGQGTLSSSTTLARTSIEYSSNSNTAVNWSAQKVYIALVEDASLQDNWRFLAGGKLTLTSGQPWTTADVLAATNVYYTPYTHNQIDLFNTTLSQWVRFEFTERTLALGTLTSGKNYDIFVYDNAGTITLELSAAWTDNTTRSDTLTAQDGVLVKNSDKTRRYLGTVRTVSTTTVEDSVANRNLFDYYWPDLWKPTDNLNRVYYAGWSAVAKAYPNIQSFTSSGTWTKPTNASFVQVYCIGQGGGGGGGAKSANRRGGAGGGGGAVSWGAFTASSLTSTVAVTCNTGGGGGAASATNPGNPGTAGSDTTFGTYLKAGGGSGGAGAAAGSVAGGAGGTIGNILGSAGATNSSDTVGGTGNSSFGPGGGGGGGSSTATLSGGPGGTRSTLYDGAGAGAAGTTTGTAGGVGGNVATGAIFGGGGGGGGAGSNPASGAAGGNGGSYGGGGGGGGSTNAGATGEAGGNGGNGICIVISW